MMKLANKSIYKKLLGSLIKKGNKVTAKNILEDSFLKVSAQNHVPINRVLSKVFSKLETFIEVKKVKRRKSIHLIPFPIKRHRQNFLKIKWLLKGAKEDTRKVNFSEKLSLEISKIFLNKKSTAVEERKYMEKQIFVNKSNLHYR